MELVLGTAQLGTDYGIQGNARPSPKNSEKLLDASIGCGISAFDTAAGYGTAEVLLGNYFERNNIRDTVRIITKLKPDILDGIPVGEYEAVLKENVKQSMRRLKTGYLDGLLFHNAEYVFRTDVIKAIINMKHPRVINKIGVSVYTPREAEEALHYNGLDIIQVPYNVLDRRLDRSGFFQKAKERGKIIFARSSLLQGLLTMPPEQLPGYMGFAVPYAVQFQSLCRELSLSPLECAVGFSAAHPSIDYLIFGTDSIKQLKEYVHTAETPMDPDIYRFIFSKFQDVPERVVMPFLWREGERTP